ALGYAEQIPAIRREFLTCQELDLTVPVAPGRGTPTALAVRNHEWNILKAIIARDESVATASLDEDNNTLLHLLAKTDSPEALIMVLLKWKDVDVNALNK